MHRPVKLWNTAPICWSHFKMGPRAHLSWKESGSINSAESFRPSPTFSLVSTMSCQHPATPATTLLSVARHLVVRHHTSLLMYHLIGIYRNTWSQDATFCGPWAAPQFHDVPWCIFHNFPIPFPLQNSDFNTWQRCLKPRFQRISLLLQKFKSSQFSNWRGWRWCSLCRKKSQMGRPLDAPPNRALKVLDLKLEYKGTCKRLVFLVFFPQLGHTSN